jgi:hypothetical protein
MAKGFGVQAPSATITSLYSQLKKIARQRTEANDNNVFVFGTTEKRKQAMAEVTHKIAQEFPDLFFQVMYLTEESPGVVIVKSKPNERLSSYVWVEQSNSTNKWLVMACVPGAWEYRCLAAWNNKQDAVDVGDKIRDSIRSMSLDDWNKRKGEYLQMLHSLPDDDDTILAVINNSTGEIKQTDSPSREEIEKLIKISRIQNEDPDNILCQIREFLPSFE